MGTRADFYIGRGAKAEWLGSVAWDGDDLDPIIAKAKSIKSYRAAVNTFLASRDDATLPSMGWPWPWNDSRTTDYAYAFDGGKVYASSFGKGWHYPKDVEKGSDEFEITDGPRCEFPDMQSIKCVTFGERSGVIIFGVK
jgi:hypothetical protein